MDIHPTGKLFSRNDPLDLSILAAGVWVCLTLAGSEDSPQRTHFFWFNIISHLLDGFSDLPGSRQYLEGLWKARWLPPHPELQGEQASFSSHKLTGDTKVKDRGLVLSSGVSSPLSLQSPRLTASRATTPV